MYRRDLRNKDTKIYETIHKCIKASNKYDKKVAHLKQTNNVKAKIYIRVKSTGYYPETKNNKQTKYNKTRCNKTPNQIKTRIKWKRGETKFQPDNKLIHEK